MREWEAGMCPCARQTMTTVTWTRLPTQVGKPFTFASHLDIVFVVAELSVTMLRARTNAVLSVHVHVSSDLARFVSASFACPPLPSASSHPRLDKESRPEFPFAPIGPPNSVPRTLCIRIPSQRDRRQMIDHHRKDQLGRWGAPSFA